MHRALLILLMAVLPALSRAAEFQLAGQKFTVPDGFIVEQVAGPPLVERPVSMDFDERGRLYVTESSGSNEPVEKQLQQAPHRVLRLEDTDGDGRFDRRTVFADRLMLPQGALWHRGSLYVAAPPSIWKLTDTDEDGVADRREEWFQGKTLTGCANDLHGPYLGPDGWIYWCKGAYAEQTYERPGKKPFVTRASHIFRARPDGSGIEAVLTGGMDNPVGVDFTSEGERLLAGTFFHRPESGKRDGIIHAIYGGVYGKPNAVVEGHKRTGELMPMLTHLGPSASADIRRYRSRGFGPEFQDNFFVANFNLHNVTRHILRPEGATFTTEDSVFFASDSLDFHPTCILEDADGSLLVIDTGGWYKICCPTSQLWKPDVLGAIYRIRRTGAPAIADARGERISWAKVNPKELSALLGDERPFVRRRAIEELAARPDKAVAPLRTLLKNSRNVEARRNAVWALSRIDAPTAREAVRDALKDADPSVRLAALHSISVRLDRPALPPVLNLLAAGEPALRRAAAEAVGRIGDATAVPALLNAAALPCDRILEHSLAYALIELNAPDPTRRGLTASSAQARRIAAIALDQMDDGALQSQDVIPLLASNDPLLKSAAQWILGHRQEWGGALANVIRDRLKDVNAATEGEVQALLAQFATDPSVQDLIVNALRSPQGSAQKLALRAMTAAQVKEWPASWSSALAEILKTGDEAIVRHAVTAARSAPALKNRNPALTGALSSIAQDKARAETVRLEALAALPPGAAMGPDLFHLAHGSLNPAKPVATRTLALTALTRAKLTEEQLLTLAEELKDAGPMEAVKLLSLFEKSPGEALARTLLAGLKEAKAVNTFRPEQLKPLFDRFPSSMQPEAQAHLASLQADAAKQAAHLDALLASLKDGDIRRGQAVFNSPKAACSACHAIGYSGGRLGPDLTKIGQVRSERDLLEAIVFPSASFVRSYEPMIVITQSGEDYSGVLKTDAPDEVVLASGPETEIRIPRTDIAEIRPGSVSVMPGGLDEQLTKQELADLLAFLKATRWR